MSEPVPVPASEAAVLSLLGIMTGLPYLAVEAFFADLHVSGTVQQQARTTVEPNLCCRLIAPLERWCMTLTWLSDRHV